MQKRGLGRGLEALIPETSALAEQEGERILSLPVGSIDRNPHQPRREFRSEEIDVLAESIRERGLLQPILVRRRGEDSFELVAGERRLRAAVRAGFARIPAIVREASEEEMLPLALVENLQREDLNPIEEAGAYRELTEGAGWTQEEVAERVGKGRAHVANTLRLLNLPPQIQRDVAKGTLSPGHARALLACSSEEEMRRLHEAILTQALTVREAEERAAGPQRSPGRRTGKQPIVRSISPETRELEERLQRVYGTPVRIHERKGRGRVSLEFYSYDDLGRLVDLLLVPEGRTAPPH